MINSNLISLLSIYRISWALEVNMDHRRRAVYPQTDISDAGQ